MDVFDTNINSRCTRRASEVDELRGWPCGSKEARTKKDFRATHVKFIVVVVDVGVDVVEGVDGLMG